MAERKELTLDEINQLSNKYQAMHVERMNEHDILLQKHI